MSTAASVPFMHEYEPSEAERASSSSRAGGRREPSSTSSTSSNGRWWFAFDRWFAVAEPEEEFVLA
jgi:hypothetical protein